MAFIFTYTGQRARMWYAYYTYPDYYYENESDITFPIYKCDDFVFTDGVLYADDIGGFDKLSQLQSLDSANWADLYTIVYDYAMDRGGTTLSGECLITKNLETDSIVNSDATDRLHISLSGDNYVTFDTGKSYSYHYKTHDCKLIMCIDANGNYGWVLANFTVQEARLISDLWTGSPLTISDQSNPFCLRSWLTGFSLGLAGKSLPYSKVIREPVAYLYNGIRLPALPEWDKEMYPYVFIVVGDITELIVSQYALKAVDIFGLNFSWYDPNTGGGYNSSSISVYALSDGEWSIPVSDSMTTNKEWNIIWTNTDIPDNRDNSIYLEATEPVAITDSTDSDSPDDWGAGDIPIDPPREDEFPLTPIE